MSDPALQPCLIGIVVRDLMFSSKITAEAKAAGIAFKVIRDPSKLADFQDDLSLLFVDLNLEGATTAAGNWRKISGKSVVGFVSHVDTDAIAAARAAGIDQVLPRSRFVQVLPQLVRAQSV